MNIAATVILYYPSMDVLANIQSYVSFAGRLYVMDNSEKADPGISRRLQELRDCVYIHDGENKGIAARLNQACRLARHDGYSSLLTMDQDSAFTHENITGYLRCIQQFSGREQVAMFGVEYEGAPAIATDCAAEEIDHLITSGSIVNLDLFDAVGGFDENLFIDGVDQEYCYKSIVAGYKIVQLKNIQMAHTLGTVVSKRSLKNLRMTPRTLHTPVRLYYIMRNHLYLKAKYGQFFPINTARNQKELFNRIKNNLLYNNRRWKVLRYLLKARADFRNKNMGKIK